MPSLAVIIVSWNTRDLLRRCLDSVRASLASADIDYMIVVVDNASTDGTPAMLRAEYPGVLLIEPGRNLGFAGGNNLALRHLCDKVTRWQGDKVIAPIDAGSVTLSPSHPVTLSVDYVLLLNPDTELVGEAIPRLVRYAEAHPDVAVVGPRLRYPDGSPQPSRRHFPTKGTFFWESTPLETRWPGNPWARRYRCADAPDDVEQEVDWLVGAALLVRREAIERAGLLDSGFAMYSEELEWQQRIRTMNDERRTMNACDGEDDSAFSQPEGARRSAFPTRIVYLPEALVIHHEGKSSEQALAGRYLNFQNSRLRHARMLYGDRFAALLRVFLRAAYGFELAVEAAKWLLGHKRPLRAQRVGVYWQVVRRLGEATLPEG